MEKNLRKATASSEGISKYEINSYFTRPPELLILDLYEGCIKFLNNAIKGFDNESYEEIHNNLVKADAIIAELRSSLNHEAGGEISKNFENLYLFISQRILEGNIRKDKKAVIEAKSIVVNMCESWSEGVIKDKV